MGEVLLHYYRFLKLVGKNHATKTNQKLKKKTEKNRKIKNGLFLFTKKMGACDKETNHYLWSFALLKIVKTAVFLLQNEKGGGIKQDQFLAHLNKVFLSPFFTVFQQQKK